MKHTTYRVGQNKHGCVRSPVGVFTRVHVNWPLPPAVPITSAFLLLPLLSPLHDTPEFRTEGVNMAEVEGPEVRKEMLVHVLICPAEQLISSSTTIAATVVVALFVCWEPRRRRWRRPDTIWKTNEVQAAVMIDLYGALGKSAVCKGMVSVWQLHCCRRRHAEGRSTTKAARKSGDVARQQRQLTTLQGKRKWSGPSFVVSCTRGNVPASSSPARNCPGRNSSTRSVRVRAIG